MNKSVKVAVVIMLICLVLTQSLLFFNCLTPLPNTTKTTHTASNNSNCATIIEKQPSITLNYKTNKLNNLNTYANTNNIISTPNSLIFNAENKGVQPTFVRVRNRNVYFYSSTSTAMPLFALIPTYYLKVLATSGEFYSVEVQEQADNYAKLSGYVLISSVEAINEVPKLPMYPSAIISVSQSSAKLYTQASSSSISSISATYMQAMGYYGKLITQQGEWYYVCFRGYLGYVSASDVTMPELTNHITPLSDTSVDIVDEVPPKEETPTEPFSPKFDSVQLALILLITVPSIVMVVVMFTPNKKKTKLPTYSYTENNSGKVQKPRYYDDYF
ncbi:MAG: hypothetical protein RR248_04085 [Clostridia bacterium]